MNKAVVTLLLFLFAFVNIHATVVIETRPDVNAIYLKGIPVEDTTGNALANYGLRLNATKDTLVWVDLSTTGSVDSLYIEYTTSAWGAAGWYMTGDTIRIDTSDGGSGTGDDIQIDTGAAVVDPTSIVLQEGTGIVFALANDTLIISASVTPVDSVTKALQDASGNIITATYLPFADFNDTLSNYLKVDSGAAVVGMPLLVLQEGDNVTLTIDGDTLVLSVDLSTYLTTSSASSIYETIVNVGKIGDDTTTWKAVAAAFDTNYQQLTVGSQVLSGDADILSEAELTDSLALRGFMTSLNLRWDTVGNKDTNVLVGTADTILKITRDPDNDTTKMTVPSGILVIQGGGSGIPAMDSLLITNTGYIRLHTFIIDSALIDSFVSAVGRFAIGAGSGADSVYVDTIGDATNMANITGAAVFREGSNITLTVNEDTIVIASSGGGTGDTVLVDTAGTGSNMADMGGGPVFREGTNVTLTVAGDTITITASASGSSVWDVIGDTTQRVDADNDTVLQIIDNDASKTTLTAGSNDTLVITAADHIQIGESAGRVWTDSLDINLYLSIGTGSNQMDSALFDSIVNADGRFSVVSGGLWDTTTSDSIIQYVTGDDDTTLQIAHTSAKKTTLSTSNDTIAVDAILATLIEGITKVDSLQILGEMQIGTGAQRLDSAIFDSIVNALGRFSLAGGAADDVRADTGAAVVDMSTIVLQGGANVTLSIVNGDTLVIASSGGGDDIKVDSGAAVVDMTDAVFQAGANVTISINGDTIIVASTGGGIFDVISDDTAQWEDVDNDTVIQFIDNDNDTTQITPGSNAVLVVGTDGLTKSDSLFLVYYLNIGNGGIMDSALIDSIDNAEGRFSVAGGSGDNIEVDTAGNGTNVYDPTSLVIQEGDNIILSLDNDTLTITADLSSLSSYLLIADFDDTLSNHLKVDSGAAIVAMTNLILQEGDNIVLTIDGDTVSFSVDLSAYLTISSASSTYETITNVGKIGDDTTTWKAVAAAFDTNYASLTAGGVTIDNDSSVVSEGELVTSLASYLPFADFDDTLGNHLKLDTVGDGSAVVSLSDLIIQKGSNIGLSLDGDTLTISASVTPVDSVNKALRDAAGNIITATYLPFADFDDTLSNHLKVDSGAAVVAMTNLILQEGSNVVFTIDGDTLSFSVDLSSYLASSTASSTYETITNVGKIGDDTTTWKAVAAAFDTNYQQLQTSALIMGGNITMSGNRITGLPTPTSDSDAVPKYYFDGGFLSNVDIQGDININGGNIVKTDLYYSADLDNVIAAHADSFFSLPLYDTLRALSDSSVTTGALHPSVLYFPNGKFGFKWWLVYTPAIGTYENPHLVVSNDGLNWELFNTVPGGDGDTLALPVFLPSEMVNVALDSVNYLSDPELFVTEEGVLGIIMRAVQNRITADSIAIFCLFTDDGITWTEWDSLGIASAHGRVNNMFQLNTYGDNQAFAMSPALLNDSAGSYKMWVVDSPSDTGEPNQENQAYVTLWESDTAYTGWSLVDTVVWPKYDSVNVDWWHHDMIRTGPSEILAISYLEGRQENGSTKPKLVISKSHDNGLSFTMPVPLLDTSYVTDGSSHWASHGLYKSCAVLIDDMGEIKLRLFYSAHNNAQDSSEYWHIGATDVLFDDNYVKKADMKTFDIVIEAPAANDTIQKGGMPFAYVIDTVVAVILGAAGDTVNFSLDEAGSNGGAGTATLSAGYVSAQDARMATVPSDNSGIDRADILRVVVSSIVGAPSQVTITVMYHEQ